MSKKEAQTDERAARVAGETVRLDKQLTGVDGRVAETSETARAAQRPADEAYGEAMT